MLRRWIVLAEVAVLLVWAGTLRAQTATISEVTFTGLRRISPETLRERIVSHTGELLDQVKIGRDMRVLARTGWFETVRVDIESAPNPAEGSGSRDRTA